MSSFQRNFKPVQDPSNLGNFDIKTPTLPGYFQEIANRFSPDKIGLTENASDTICKLWAKEKCRMIYFATYQNPTVKELAERVNMPEPTTRTHIGLLESAGLILRSNKGEPVRYSVSLSPFTHKLGKDNEAIQAIRDHFLSADPLIVPHEGSLRASLHNTLYTVAAALQNPERIKIYHSMRNQKAQPFVLKDIQKILNSESEQAAGHAIKPLLKAGLVEPTPETKNNYTQRNYRAVLQPFITIINDLNDEFGEGKIIDLSKKSSFSADRILEDESARNKYYEKTAEVFKTLKTEGNMKILRWFDKRPNGRMASEWIEQSKDSKPSTDFVRIRKLKECKLLRVSGSNGTADLLKVDWRPLRDSITGLVGA